MFTDGPLRVVRHHYQLQITLLIRNTVRSRLSKLRSGGIMFQRD